MSPHGRYSFLETLPEGGNECSANAHLFRKREQRRDAQLACKGFLDLSE